MNENDIATGILDIAFDIHREIGPGLLESVYEAILEAELQQKGFAVKRQAAVPIRYRGLELDEAFRADLIVNRAVIVELKSVVSLQPVHNKQLLTYLRLSGLHLGLLINFNTVLLKDGISRVVNDL